MMALVDILDDARHHAAHGELRRAVLRSAVAIGSELPCQDHVGTDEFLALVCPCGLLRSTYHNGERVQSEILDSAIDHLLEGAPA